MKRVQRGEKGLVASTVPVHRELREMRQAKGWSTRARGGITLVEEPQGGGGKVEMGAEAHVVDEISKLCREGDEESRRRTRRQASEKLAKRPMQRPL